MTERIFPQVHWVHSGFYMKTSQPPPDPEKVREWLEEAWRLCGLDPVDPKDHLH